MKQTVFDHVAIGTRTLADGWQLFGGLLGGAWVYGGDSPEGAATPSGPAVPRAFLGLRTGRASRD